MSFHHIESIHQDILLWKKTLSEVNSSLNDLNANPSTTPKTVEEQYKENWISAHPELPNPEFTFNILKRRLAFFGIDMSACACATDQAQANASSQSYNIQNVPSTEPEMAQQAKNEKLETPPTAQVLKKNKNVMLPQDTGIKLKQKTIGRFRNCVQKIVNLFKIKKCSLYNKKLDDIIEETTEEMEKEDDKKLQVLESSRVPNISNQCVDKVTYAEKLTEINLMNEATTNNNVNVKSTHDPSEPALGFRIVNVLKPQANNECEHLYLNELNKKLTFSEAVLKTNELNRNSTINNINVKSKPAKTELKLSFRLDNELKTDRAAAEKNSSEV